MDETIDKLSKLSPDLFINQITYLPFNEVIAVCSSNKILHEYCINSKYSSRWKLLIDNTFSSVYNYPEKLKQIQTKLNTNGYNYLVYTQLIKLLDPVTQAMIYYKQKDMKSFEKFTKVQQFLALFLLNERSIIEKYIPEKDDNYEEVEFDYSSFIDVLNKKPTTQTNLDNMIIIMAENGNVRGIIMIKELGGNIHAYNESAFIRAAQKGHLDVVKYLIDNGSDIHIDDDLALVLASQGGHLDLAKYLLGKGANIHASNDDALKIASQFGYLDLVKYFTSIEKFIFDSLNEAYIKAMENNHIEVAEYLETLFKSN